MTPSLSAFSETDAEWATGMNQEIGWTQKTLTNLTLNIFGSCFRLLGRRQIIGGHKKKSGKKKILAPFEVEKDLAIGKARLWPGKMMNRC